METVCCGSSPIFIPSVTECGSPPITLRRLAGRFAERVGLYRKPGVMAACGDVTTQIAAKLGLPVVDRPAYDKFMLKIHHAMKEDVAFQQTCRKDRWEFPSGSTWIVFTDGASHACLSGQYALEQTFTIGAAAWLSRKWLRWRCLKNWRVGR